MEVAIRKLLFHFLLKEKYEFEYKDLFVPNDNMVNTCRNALNIIQNNNLTQNGGDKGNGLKKAKDICDKKPMSHEMVARMKSYFQQNLGSYQKEISAGKNINNSGIIQSWDLWGGNAGKEWANSKISSHKDSNLNSKKIRNAFGLNDTDMNNPNHDIRIHK